MTRLYSFKCCFTITCIFCTLSMVGYWIYKYFAEDRDIGVVDYKSFEESLDNPFPVVSFCFDSIFLPRAFPNNNISSNYFEYIQYLKGEIADETYASLTYPNITIDLENYFLFEEVKWANETSHRNGTLSIKHTPNFNGIYYLGEFRKCFEVSSNIQHFRHVKEVNLYYNKTKMLHDLEGEYPIDVFFNIHHSGQFFLAPNDPTFIQINGGWENHNVWIEDIELLKSRNSQWRTCTPDFGAPSYDNMVLQEHLLHKGCIPPYLAPYQGWRICKTQEEMKFAMYSFNTIRKKYVPISCKRISKIYYLTQVGEELENNSTWRFSMVFPDFIRVITQTKEVDIHRLIGNIGGYVGFFLGDKNILISYLYSKKPIQG